MTVKKTYYEKFDEKAIAKRSNNGPSVDNVVTVENCYYYMSLLESFYKVERSLGPELFKLYIIAAERRYLEFLRNLSNSSLPWQNYDKPVSLDIAYAWHAHMLAPYQYKEDIDGGINIQLAWTKDFPLRAMRENLSFITTDFVRGYLCISVHTTQRRITTNTNG
ncbi:hypothetical protein BDA99DRAFT_249459 [Phascolomyces articulosus]|uniref:Uncharacterized protein n=1 Tax=Phascolomyces articulosus TaxID=60185 RepID=A0AAD5K8Z4_9FUNG|nr:hypothetical protein BDA99DRAFT_249459 [Phascolomyces articulosus]